MSVVCVSGKTADIVSNHRPSPGTCHRHVHCSIYCQRELSTFVSAVCVFVMVKVLFVNDTVRRASVSHAIRS